MRCCWCTTCNGTICNFRVSICANSAFQKRTSSYPTSQDLLVERDLRLLLVVLGVAMTNAAVTRGSQERLDGVVKSEPYRRVSDFSQERRRQSLVEAVRPLGLVDALETPDESASGIGGAGACELHPHLDDVDRIRHAGGEAVRAPSQHHLLHDEVAAVDVVAVAHGLCRWTI